MKPANTTADGEPLRIEHRSLIEPMLTRLDCGLSEYCFANLYLFRSVHQYRLRLEPVPHVLGVTYDHVTHVMPLVPIECCNVLELLQEATCIYPISRETAEAARGSDLAISWNEDDSDYIYDARRLALLEGRMLRPKRQQARNFAAEVHPMVVRLSSLNRAKAYEVLDLWVGQRGGAREDTDFHACFEALQHQEELGMGGLLVSGRDGVPHGFLLTSPLGGGGVAVHFAKGNRREPGVYPYMFSQLVAQPGANWLNFEQDLGMPGLRRAKRALDPLRTLRKCRLTVREAAQIP